MDMPILIAALILGALLLGALSAKWCLPRATSGLLILFSTLVAGVIAVATDTWVHQRYLFYPAVVIVQFAAYALTIAYRFYRDPDRFPPADPSAVVSPADGTVIYIRRLAPGSIVQCQKMGKLLEVTELEQTELSTTELWQIGISMVFTDVHVNRAPISGRIGLLAHRPGLFRSLRDPHAINVNERQLITIDNGAFEVALIQIASRLVRRIEAYVRSGQEITRAQRVGIIKFGSQVDVLIPTYAMPTARVNEGDYLQAGESVLGHIDHSAAPRGTASGTH